MASQDCTLKLSSLNPLAPTFEPKMKDRFVEANGPEPLQQSDAPIAVSKPLTDFHPFKRMPSELRLKIWKLNIPGARVVELKYKKGIYHAVSPTPAPALLHVCHEVSFSLFLCSRPFVNIRYLPSLRSTTRAWNNG
jgi:hypothetical protein